MKRLTVLILMASVMLSVSCGPAVAPTPADNAPQVPGAPATPAEQPPPIQNPVSGRGPIPSPAIQLGVMFNRIPDVISPYGKSTEVNLTFTNQASDSRVMVLFPPKIWIIGLPDVNPRDSAVRYFLPPVPIQPPKHLELAANESADYRLTWDQKDDSGQQVAPGWYGVKVTIDDKKASDTTVSQVSGVPTRVLVLPPEGVLEKTIEVNQSRTVNGIAFTLQKVELTATGIKVYAFNTPPGYNLPQGPMLAPPQLMIAAFAEYGFDDGPMKLTYPSGIRFLDNGMLHTWAEYLDPAPANAKELTFRITKLGEGAISGVDPSWEGPWEFRVPLQ